ncbi:GTPase Era [Sphaerochaeta sp. PS]|uniref:GTPase Era n=1 Tax=Sphaerochaeta sp. PS TaxID=3076336 RepID=UPI0028A4A404|nr:GTPase Era [Sphaerochaeta sp. PS]MDT4761177.1 GTPase Era [Sphaerochaeta sp. PS]
MKCATVAIIGRPSAGKSTLLNTITEMKVSITASTPQTTRNAIRGIYTDPRGQLIFTDTPGYHLSEKVMNKRLQDTAVRTLEDSDIILYIIDAKRTPGDEEKAITALLAKVKTPVVACINKSDILTIGEHDAAKAFLAEQLPAAVVITASAKLDEGVDEILIELYKLAPEGELLYPEDAYTDQPVEFRVSEIIREKAINLVTEEIPHAIYVTVEDIEHKEETNTIWIRAAIIVERETQKGIVVGKGGANIKKIRQGCTPEIRAIFPGKKLELDLRVKAQDKWRNNASVLDRILR